MQRTSSRDYPFDHSPLYLVSPSEGQVQSAVFEFLAGEEIPGLAVDADGKPGRRQGCCAVKAAGVRHGALVKRSPGAALGGLTDIVGTLPGGRALYLEVKAPAWMRLNDNNHLRVDRSDGQPSEEQLAFMDKKAEAGALVGVVWSVDDLVHLLKGAR